MAQYGTPPVWPALLFMALMYVLFLCTVAHAAIGITRTAAVTLPLQMNRGALKADLIPLDYSPKLWVFSGVGRKALKIAVLAGGGVFAAVNSWVIILWFIGHANSKLFGWTLVNDAVVITLHVVLQVGVCAGAAWYGARTASRYELEPPYKRLNAYLIEQLEASTKGYFNPKATQYEGSTPVYELKLPTGNATVMVCMNEESACWFEVRVPRGTVRLGPTTKLDRKTRASVNAVLGLQGI